MGQTSSTIRQRPHRRIRRTPRRLPAGFGGRAGRSTVGGRVPARRDRPHRGWGRSSAGSLSGGICEIQEMPDFCGEQGGGAEVEVVPAAGALA